MSSSYKLVKNIWKVLPNKEKRSSRFFLVLLVISGFFELSTLAVIYPFLYLIINNKNEINLPLINLDLTSLNYEGTLNILSISLLFFIFISALFRLVTNYKLHMQVANISSFLSSNSFMKTINQPYEYHILENSNKTISISTQQVNDLYQGINNIFNLINNIIICFFIFFAVIIISPRITLSALLSLSIFFLIISLLMKKRLVEIGNKIATTSESQVKLMQESLSSIKDVIINNLAGKYSFSYKKKDLLIRKQTALGNFYNSFPRYLTESFILIVVISIIYISSVNNLIDNSLFALLGTFALAIQKLIPGLQQIYASWSGFNTKAKSIQNILERCNLTVDKQYDHKVTENKKFKFINEIKFSGVSFRYKENMPYIIDNINFQIKKSSKLGIVGKTGAGKTTFVDLLLGLISPSKGKILVDGENINNKRNIKLWHKKISYVSQDIYLSDNTFIANIASSFEEEDKNIDLSLVIEAAKKAYIHDFINSLPNKYKTMVGERGTQLSGGQIQRISIARAIYKKSEIIVLDEPTSALDLSTEKMIMNSIYSNFKNATLIVIAHRISTLEKCDEIYEIKNKNLDIFKI